MNSVIYQLLEELNDAGGEADIYQICENLGITRRILNYNLEKLNYALEKDFYSPIIIENGSLKMCVSDQAVYERIRKIICNSYVLSRRERKALIFYQSALCNHLSNLDQMAQWLGVSRSTLIAEVNELKNELLKMQLYLKSTKNGYVVVGEEEQIRYILMETFYEEILALPEEVRLQYLNPELNLCKSEDDILENIIWDSEKLISGHYSFDSIKEIVRYCNLIRLRNRQGAMAVLYENMKELPEFKAAEFILEKWNDNGEKIKETEIGYLALVLLSTRLNELETTCLEKEVKGILEDFLQGFEETGLISFNRKSDLYRMLAIHIRAMYYRVRYRIKIHNPFTKEIIEKYYGIFSITQKIVMDLEKKYQLNFNTEEIAYLSIYIGGFLKSESPENNLEMKKILLLCGSGLGTSYLLKQQTVGLIGDAYRYVIKDYRSFEPEMAGEYALILSTVDTGFVCNNLMKVNSLMTRSQKENLLSWRLEEIKADKNSPMNRIVSIIEQYTTIQDTENLLRDLRMHVKKDDGTLHLSDVVKSDYIQILEQEEKLEEAIRISCRPLLEDGIIAEHYVTAIMDIIGQYGLYFEYVPGILLAHANAPEDVYRVGISLTVLKKPLQYEEKKIQYIFTVATPNYKDHAAALDELFKIMVGEKLKSMNVADATVGDYSRLLKCVE